MTGGQMSGTKIVKDQGIAAAPFNFGQNQKFKQQLGIKQAI